MIHELVIAEYFQGKFLVVVQLSLSMNINIIAPLHTIQVKNAGSGVPRFLTLEVYVPEVDRELPDWEVMEGDEDEVM